MKKFLKVALTILFVVASVFAIYRIVVNFSADKMVFIAIAFTLFLMHLFAWIAPKTFFNICWKITNFLPDDWNYNISYRQLENCDIGILITSIIFLGISFLF